MQDKEITFIDLFAGTSALSEGFVRCGFSPIAHIEMDRDACYTIKTRLAYHYLNEQSNILKYQEYVTGKITRDTLYQMIPDEIINSVINIEISDQTIDGIFEKLKRWILLSEVRHVRLFPY